VNFDRRVALTAPESCVLDTTLRETTRLLRCSNDRRSDLDPAATRIGPP